MKNTLALDYFTNTSCNCAQSILLSYCEEFNITKESASKISAAFGGGIGRQGETCGAVIGALMVLGLKSNLNFLEDKEAKQKMLNLTKEFIFNFKQLNGSLKCRDLLGCDIDSEVGQNYIKEHNLHKTVCEKVISNSIELLEKMI